MVHLHSVHGESWWMTIGFVLTITRESGTILRKVCHPGFEKKSYTVGCCTA